MHNQPGEVYEGWLGRMAYGRAAVICALAAAGVSVFSTLVIYALTGINRNMLGIWSQNLGFVLVLGVGIGLALRKGNHWKVAFGFATAMVLLHFTMSTLFAPSFQQALMAFVVNWHVLLLCLLWPFGTAWLGGLLLGSKGGVRSRA